MKLKTLFFSMILSTSCFSYANGITPPPVTITFDGRDYKVTAESFSGIPTGSFLAKLQSTPWFNTPNPSNVETVAANYYSANEWAPNTLNSISGGQDGPYLLHRYESPQPDFSKLYADVIFRSGSFGLQNYTRTSANDDTNPGATIGIELNGIYYWLVLAGPSAADTLISMQSNTIALRNTLNLQSAKTVQGLTYDCTVFDANNMCVSFAGTRSYGNDGIDNTTGALIIAHRPTANIRVGGYVDQTMGTTDSNGLKVKRGSPGYGVFGVWSQRTDGLGTEVRLAANSGSVDIETTRQAIGTAEAGFGQSNIKSNGVQLELSQGYAANNKVIVRPYVGYRQMANKRAAYTELTSDSVQNPLAYSALKQTTESVLVGSKFFAKLTPKTTLNSNFGFEHDVKMTVDNYQAANADIGTITPVNMSSNVKKTRPIFSVGVVHALDKTQTVGFSLTHRKEALASSSTWSAYTTYGMLQYSVGF